MKILSRLLNNCRKPDRQIGMELGISGGAVGSRISKMEKLGIIEKFCLKVQPPLLGLNMFYIVVNSQNQKEIIKNVKLAGMPFTIVPCVGGNTVIGVIVKEDMEQKIELLQKLMQDVRVMSVFEADNTKITHNLTRTDLEILKQLIENPRKRIEQLDDYRTHFGDDVKDQVVALGLAYNLASKYTSFVAVDDEIISNKGALNTTKQPLPMTLGVKYSSIGIEAKIKGTTVLQREFTITIKSEIKNPKKLKKWLLNTYSKIIKEYLKKYPKIKIYINKKGDVTHVKREENGSWLEDFKLINIMNKVPKKLHIKNEVIITIKKIMYPKKEKI